MLTNPPTNDDGRALTPDEVETLLALALRQRSIWDYCDRSLANQPLRLLLGAGYALLWQTVQHIVRHTNGLPAAAALRAALQAALEQTPLDAQQLQAVNQLLELAYDDSAWQAWADQPQFCQRWARHLLKRLLLSWTAQEAQRRLAASESLSLSQLPGLLQDLAQRAKRAESVAFGGIEPVFPANWLERPLRDVTPTLIPALDNFFGGGMAPGELYTFLGPIGSCKTTIAVQLCVRFAKHAAYLEASGALATGQRAVAVLVTTELSAQDMRVPLLANAALVPRQRLRTIRSLEELCRFSHGAATPATQYEQELFSDQIATGVGFRNEYQRAKEAIELLNRHVWLLDLSGNNPDLPELGYGGIADIEALLQQQQEAQPNTKPIFLAIDHASALAARLARDHGHLDQLRHHLRFTVADARQKLAKPYQMPVLLLHQLSGAANRANPLAEISSFDAAECKSFVEYTDFAVVSGVPTRTVPRLARLRCDKFRHQPPQSDAIIRVEGEFSRVRDVSDEYTIDPLTRQFALRSDVAEDDDWSND